MVAGFETSGRQVWAGCLSVQAAGPGVGVFWGTAGLDRGGHFCSVAFSFLEILAIIMKQGF